MSAIVVKRTATAVKLTLPSRSVEAQPGDKATLRGCAKIKSRRAV